MMKSNLYGAVCATLVALAATPLSSHGATIELNFGTTTSTTFNEDLLMQFADVADFGTTGIDINATLTAAATWNAPCDTNACGSFGPWPHGGVSDDLRVNSDGGETAYLTLTLYDGSVGDGYTNLYDPGSDYDWTLAFYDIDSNAPSGSFPDGSSWDEVTLLTAGTYQVTGTTDLTITDLGGGGVNFSGAGVGNIPGQDGLSSPITQQQADVMVLYTLMNTNSVDFIYYVGETFEGVQDPNPRNLLVDGGSLALATCSDAEGGDCGFEPPVGVVPIPAAVWLFASGLIGLVGIARRRRIS
jgi:hypothetical protein